MKDIEFWRLVMVGNEVGIKVGINIQYITKKVLKTCESWIKISISYINTNLYQPFNRLTPTKNKNKTI
jgi:hypothetical protein